MENFEKINFDTFLDYFEEANDNGFRIRMGEYDRWWNFVENNDISFLLVSDAISLLPDSKVTIIEEGKGKGLFLYSWNMDNSNSNYCYKYKAAASFHKNSKSSSNTFSKDEQRAILFTLYGIMKVDGRTTDEEKSYLAKILFNVFDGDKELFDSAINLTPDEAMDIIETIHDEKRKKFLEMMWDMAHVDGEFDKKEEQFMRAIDELMLANS